MINPRLKHALIAGFTRLFGDKDGLVLFPVLLGPARGLRFRFDLLTRLEVAFLVGTHETSEARLLAKICKPNWVVWDCGIYLGYYTAMFARLVGPQGRVVAFEADPRNLARAKQHTELNRFSNVQFVHAAIGGPLGQTTFLLSNNTNSHLPGAYVGETPEDYRRTTEKVESQIQVRCMSLDQAFEDPSIPPPDLIKIDIDGAELGALPYTYKLAKSKKPVILLELHNHECEAAAWEFAKETGYSLQSTETGSPIKTREEVRATILCLPPK